MDAWFWLAAGTAVFWIAFGWDVFRGNRAIRALKDVDPGLPEPVPRVSIIIAARNEEKKIGEALRSVLGLEYTNFECIVVNDRSTDRTGAILEGLTQQHPELRVVSVEELPHGWLGKNHALYRGAHQATGELLLFADADVVMDPSTLARAVAYLQGRSLDHLTIGLDVRMPGLFLQMFLASFMIFFAMYARPWKASDPKSSWHIGIGGFNLVRSQVYWSFDGHRAIPMRPDDDMKLGKLIKKHGFSQEMVFGKPLICVEWYDSIAELILGLEKNAFAGVEYNVAAVVAGSLLQIFLQVWPFAAVFLTSAPTCWLNGFIVVVILALTWDCARFNGSKRWHGVAFPVMTLFFIYILWRTMVVVLVGGGIQWRGTNYALKDLRANRV